MSLHVALKTMMSGFHPRLKFVLALMPLWALPIVYIFLGMKQLLPRGLADAPFLNVEAAPGYLLPLISAALIATVLGLLLSSRMHSGFAFAILGFLSALVLPLLLLSLRLADDGVRSLNYFDAIYFGFCLTYAIVVGGVACQWRPIT